MRVVNVLLLLAILLVPAGAFAQTFPADADWEPLMRDGLPVPDIEGDVVGSRDIVGDTTNGAAFLYSDGSYLYLRLRLDDDPRDNSLTGLDPFSWGVEFESDGNFDTFEGLVMVDGISNPEEVSVQQNTVQGTIGDPSDQAEIELANYPYTTHGRVVTAPTMFAGTPDYFLDFAVLWTDLAPLGVIPGAPFRIILGSGNSANSFAADIGTSISDEVSDQVSCGPTGCNTSALTVTITNPPAGTSTNDSTPTFAGQTEPGATVEVTINAGTATEEVATVTANAQGVWTYTATTSLADGANTVSVVATLGGSTGMDSATFTVDTVAPVVTIDAPADGSSSTTRTPTISGTAEPGATVTLVFNEGTAAERTVTVTADGAGNWTYTPANQLPTGANTITASSTDAAGNVGSDDVNFTISVGLDVAINTPGDATSINDATPAITGTGEPGETVTIVIDAGTANEQTATVTVAGDGTWSHTPATALGEGAHTVDVSQDGTSGVTTDSVGFTVDTVAPMVRIIDPADGTLTGDATPEIEGSTDEPNATVTIVIDAGTADERTATVTADANGNWSYAPTAPLADGAHTIEATVTDAAGNSDSDSVTFTVDSNLPFVVINQPTDMSATADATPTISGRTDPGATVELTFDAGTADEFTVTVTADGAGNWSYTPDTALSEGKHEVVASVTSVGGSVGTDEVDFEVDTTPPVVTITDPIDGSSVNDAAPSISGTTEPGATVVVTIGGTTYTTTADATGNWTVEIDPLADGSHTASAQATDRAGNVGDPAEVTFEVDTTGPPIAITAPGDGEEVEGTPTITGTSEPGAAIEIYVDGVLIGSTTADENGDWSFDVPEDAELAAGEHVIEVVGRDAGGNEASDSVTISVGPGDDRDGDGINDDVEEMLGTDPNNPDSDDDGLTDGEEINDWGTDPLDPDSDDDGLDDGTEIDLGTNPNAGDTDGDGLGDAEEETLGTDPRNPDTDGGGVPDGLEVENGTDPLDPADDRASGFLLSGSGCSSVPGQAGGFWLLLGAAFVATRRRRRRG